MSILGSLVPLFWISGDVSSGFQSQSGFCLIRIAEANVMYIPQDPPLVLHMPTSWQPACRQSCPHILLQKRGCRDSNSCSQNICESDALSTELNRDGLARTLLILNKKSRIYGTSDLSEIYLSIRTDRPQMYSCLIGSDRSHEKIN